MIMICGLSLKFDFRRQRDTLERQANSNKYSPIGGAWWACYHVTCSMHIHSGTRDTLWLAFLPLHSQEPLLPLKSALSC